eukprot:scaffold2061_cov246-Pinguiococcus_pyrenoidosus.AAC.2
MPPAWMTIGVIHQRRAPPSRSTLARHEGSSFCTYLRSCSRTHERPCGAAGEHRVPAIVAAPKLLDDAFRPGEQRREREEGSREAEGSRQRVPIGCSCLLSQRRLWRLSPLHAVYHRSVDGIRQTRPFCDIYDAPRAKTTRQKRKRRDSARKLGEFSRFPPDFRPFLAMLSPSESPACPMQGHEASP